MAKKNVFLLSISMVLWVTLIYIFLFEKNISHKSQSLSHDILLKNLSWESTLWWSIPYKKWDEIEVTFIFPWDGKNHLSIDTTKQIRDISIKKIFIDDSVPSSDDIIIEDGQTLKIIAETLKDGILKKEDFDDIILENEKIKEEENKENKEKSFSGTLDIMFERNILSSHINHLIEISWSQKDLIKYVNIWWNSFTPIQNNGKVYLAIEKNTFSSGEYFIIIQLQNGEIVSLDKKFYFEYWASQVNIANITPNNIKNTQDTFLVLQGNGFSKVISIQLSNNIILKNTSFDIINDSVMSVKIPSGLETGKYYFNIMTVNGIHELKQNSFIIND